MIRRLAVTAVLVGSVLTAVGTADAARGGKKGNAVRESSGSSIVLDQAAPARGEQITFTVSTSATDRPFSYVTCYQGGAMVYHSTRGHFADYYQYYGEPIHTLSSLAWTSGDADCTAELTYMARNGRMRTAASTSFQVSG
jgi:hypothetical protein